MQTNNIDSGNRFQNAFRQRHRRYVLFRVTVSIAEWPTIAGRHQTANAPAGLKTIKIFDSTFATLIDWLFIEWTQDFDSAMPYTRAHNAAPKDLPSALIYR